MANSTNPLTQIKHVVVLMMENRSFDNIVGWLYYPSNKSPSGQSFIGLTGSEWNLLPPTGNQQVIVSKGTDTLVPTPDPGELFQNVNRQLFGQDPPPNPLPTTTNMDFLLDYYLTLSAGSLAYDPTQIMNCFDPSVLPNISALAQQYAICDQWYASVPSQTWPNRSFVHAATSCGQVNNFPSSADDYDAPTIFNQIAENSELSWAVYYDDWLISLTWLQMKQLQGSQFASNFKSFSHFASDASQGNLPSYAFIEPNFYPTLTTSANDMHPPHDAALGDQFIGTVYNDICGTQQWKDGEILLVITWDEHGGCYDHVEPPANATPPGDNYPGAFGFDFTRFGVRVPTLVVHPSVTQGSVFSATGTTPFDHTSILQSIEICFGLKNLTQRDAAAPDLGQVLDGPQPQAGTDCVKMVFPSPGGAPSATDLKGPLNDLQKGMVAAMASLSGVAPEKHPDLMTEGEGAAFLHERKKIVFRAP